MSNADASLRLNVNTTDIEIGKAIPVSIIAENINAKLSSIDIHELQNNFGMEIIESANKIDNGVNIQELQINLYPRQLGSTKIPSIYLEGFSTPPLTLMVKPAKIINDVVDFGTNYSTDSVWQRQQIILTTTIITPSKFARIEIEDFILKGVETIKIRSKKTILNNGLYKLTIGWKIFPLVSGKQTLTPPSINYWLNGKIQRKFFPKTKIITIKKLPSYIPPLMAVGTLKIESAILPDYLWRIKLSSPDISPTTLESLSIPLDAMTNIKYSPFIASKSSDGYFTHDIPLEISSSSLVSLPKLVFKTFNPLTGKIDTYQTSKINFIYITPLLKTALIIIGILILYKILLIILNYTRKVFLHKNKQSEIINSSLTANSPYELHHILNNYAESEQWGRNMPLSQLSLILTSEKNHSAEDLMNELSSACYAKGFQSSYQIELNKKVYDLLRS